MELTGGTDAGQILEQNKQYLFLDVKTRKAKGILTPELRFI